MNAMHKLALTAVLAATGVANGATITSSDTNPLQTTEIDQELELDLFDSNLGTLNQVEIAFSGEAVTTISLTNNAAQQQTVSATSQINFFLNPTSVGDLSIPAPAFVIELGTGFVNLAPGESQLFGPLNDTATFSQTLTTNLGAFQAAGGGDLDFTCTTLSGLNLVGGGGNVTANQDTQAACSASVIYTFDEDDTPNVPVPASILLLALGLGAFAFRRQ